MSAVEDRLLALATCLCAELEASTVTPGVCYCGVLPGESVAFDYSGDCDNKCGMAWVRLANAYPSAQVGVPDTTMNNCSALMGLDVEIGVVRCVEGMDDQGNPPPASAMLAATIWQIEDMLAMQRAVVCCPGSKAFVLNAYAPIGPGGGMVGGTWLVSMQAT